MMEVQVERSGGGCTTFGREPGARRTISMWASMNIAATRRNVAHNIPSRWAITEQFVCVCYVIDRKYRIAERSTVVPPYLPACAHGITTHTGE
jgi:hypothetical protein